MECCDYQDGIDGVLVKRIAHMYVTLVLVVYSEYFRYTPVVLPVRRSKGGCNSVVFDGTSDTRSGNFGYTNSTPAR